MQIESLDTVYNNLHCRFPLSPRGVCLPCPFLSCEPSFLFWLLSVQSKKAVYAHPGHFLPRGLPTLLGSPLFWAGMTSAPGREAVLPACLPWPGDRSITWCPRDASPVSPQQAGGRHSSGLTLTLPAWHGTPCFLEATQGRSPARLCTEALSHCPKCIHPLSHCEALSTVSSLWDPPGPKLAFGPLCCWPPRRSLVL